MTEDDVIDEVMTASRAFVAVALRSFESVQPKITVVQHRVLVLLAARGPQIIGSLANELDVNSSNATRQCDRLERKGLVTRGKSASDGRAVEVSLTSRGREVIDEVTAVRRAELSAMLATMTVEARQDLVPALRAFNAVAGELHDRDWTGV
jgi:DNA-binding MarR family transcriptional regulator